MSRPARIAIDRSAPGWVAQFNANFTALLDGPFPIAFYTDAAALTTAKNPKLYKDCFAMASGILYKSNGSSWLVFRSPVAYIADLDSGIATEITVKSAFNGLLASLKSNGWMD